VRDLEALEAVAALGLLADDVEHRVDELGALGVVPLGPVVSGSGLFFFFDGVEGERERERTEREWETRGGAGEEGQRPPGEKGKEKKQK
jgi:hypothetical protein